jgi:hypothetical protein
VDASLVSIGLAVCFFESLPLFFVEIKEGLELPVSSFVAPICVIFLGAGKTGESSDPEDVARGWLVDACGG